MCIRDRSSFEIHSPPNGGQDDKDRNINITDEINITNDSAIQLTPKLDSKNKKPNDKDKELSCLLYTSRCV